MCDGKSYLPNSQCQDFLEIGWFLGIFTRFSR